MKSKAILQYDEYENVNKRCHIGYSETHSMHSYTLNKKGSFPLRISLVNVTKSTQNCGFDHIY